jgi:hypothetical protein
MMLIATGSLHIVVAFVGAVVWKMGSCDGTLDQLTRVLNVLKIRVGELVVSPSDLRVGVKVCRWRVEVLMLHDGLKDRGLKKYWRCSKFLGVV